MVRFKKEEIFSAQIYANKKIFRTFAEQKMKKNY